MSHRRYERQSSPGRDRLRKEWVSLDGGDVCCWELTAAEMLQMAERAARPAVDPRGGVSASVAAVWLVALATRYDDQAASGRVWDDLNFEEVYQLRFEEFARLQQTLERLNGLDPQELNHLRDFTAATAAPKPSGSSGSASKSSTGSRKKSTGPITS
jgi:hypothetical protein